MSWCIDCGDDFRYDDCGGYNPPCVCGAHCRSCHDATEREGCCDLCDRPWNDCECDGEAVSVNRGRKLIQREPGDPTSRIRRGADE